MNCRPESLEELVYGFLDDERAHRVRGHAAVCHRCAASLSRLETERAALTEAAARAELSARPSRRLPVLPLAFAAALLLGLIWLLAPGDPAPVASISPSSPQDKKETPAPLDGPGLKMEIVRLEQALEKTSDKQERGRIQAAIDDLKVELSRAAEGKPVKKGEMTEKPQKKGPTRFDELTKALEKSPDDPALLTARAEEGVKTKRWDEGARDARKAILLDPKNARAHWILGQACRYLKLNDEAEQAFARAAQLDPKLSGEIRHFQQTSKVQQELDATYGRMKMSTDPDERARLEMKAKELGQELKLLSQGESLINIKEVELRLQQDPNDVLALVDRASWYLESAKAAPALKDLDRAIELKADHAPAWLKRAVAHAWLGDMTRAWADVKRGETLDPKNMKAVEYTQGTLKKLFQSAKDKQRPAGDLELEITGLKERLEELRAMASNADLPAADRDRAHRDAQRVGAEIEKLKAELQARPPEPEKKFEKKK